MPRALLHPLPGALSEQVRERLRQMLAHIDDLRSFTPPLGAWMPPIDLCEMPDALIIRVEMPGVKREHLRVSIENNLLKIEGRKERIADTSPETSKPLRYLCLERAYGSFTRQLALRWPIEVGQVTSKLAEGVLTIRLPKAISCGREVMIPIGD
jgi:HSP20 family molecular chaperone IbpA